VTHQLIDCERRRIAADIHDLIMQDLSFALATTRSIAADPAQARDAASVAAAASERALGGARELLELLCDGGRASLPTAVKEAARSAARGVALTFQGPERSTAAADQLTIDVLVHVTRESVTNAVKHACPGHIDVGLSRHRGWRLVVRDDGSGIDPSLTAVLGAGFGQESMRRQAAALGGSLRIASSPSSGTVVECLVP
jgi:signal transduction histidine kinase